jgi:hypothetical protein
VCTLCSWEVAINLKKSLIRTCKNCFSLFKSQERCKINITLRNEVEKRRNVPGKSYDVRQYTGTVQRHNSQQYHGITEYIILCQIHFVRYRERAPLMS